MANHLCLSVSLIRELTGQAAFPKSSSPCEPLPSSLGLESTFQLCFSSCTYSHMLCRLCMWTARLSMLCAYCHIQFSDTTPRRIHYLPEVLKRNLQLPARSQSWLISSCGFFFSSSLSESFPFSVFWWGPARILWLKQELCVRMHCMSGDSLGK